MHAQSLRKKLFVSFEYKSNSYSYFINIEGCKYIAYKSAFALLKYIGRAR